jgi:tRNA A-37 threonylcarbamoyl transferase component Bud32
MSQASTACPKCGAAIPPEAPQGLCPKCLLQQASFPTETGPGSPTRHTRPAPPDRDELARAFPHLQILELIGQGGMGFVYKARQPKLDRLVALKILAQPLAEQTAFAERFTREGRTLAKLNHPNIVTIHDFGQAGPFFYLLMEYVDGVNLRQAMRAGAVNSTQALAIVPRICDALQYAHNEAVLHRDIKPDNILLDTRGRVKIADFGIAKLLAEAVAENPLTGAGATLGTPHYMAPEQIEKPNAVDHRADIYSLGVVFYEMLTGELPLGRFAAPSATSGNDPRLDEIVFQTLEKQPDRRPQSASEVGARVETISNTPAGKLPPVDRQNKPSTLFTPLIGRPMAKRFALAIMFLMIGVFLFDLVYVVQRRRSPILDLVTDQVRNRQRRDRLQFQQQSQGRPLENVVLYATNIGGGHMLVMNSTTAPAPGEKFVPVIHYGGGGDWSEQNDFTAVHQENGVHTYLWPVLPPFESVDIAAALSRARESISKTPLRLATNAVTLVYQLDSPRTRSLSFGLKSVTRDSEFTSLTSAPAQNPKGDSRPVHISYVGAGNSHFYIYVKTEPVAGEHFLPLIRYGNGPWGESDSVNSTLRWIRRHRSERTNHYDQMMSWYLPKNFATDFELAAAELRTRVRIEEGPFDISPTGTMLFAITNTANHVISGGIRLKKSDVPPNENPVATFKHFNISYNNNDSSAAPRGIQGYGRSDIPAGYRVQPIAREAGEERTTTHIFFDHVHRFVWPTPLRMAPMDHTKFDLSKEHFEVKRGEPVQIFAFTNQAGLVYEALLELVPLPGINNPTQTSR